MKGIPNYLTRLGRDWRGPTPPDFRSREAAQTWMVDVALKREAYHDNFRFAYVDDQEMMVAYGEVLQKGCCGYADIRITVLGQEAIIGCNFGH